jgi:hypothetical protein
MAFNVSNVTGYVQANERALIAKAILKAKTAGLISFQPGVKGTAQLNLLNAAATLQAGGCGWNTAGTTTITKRNIVTGLFKVNQDLCEKDLVGTFAEWGVKSAVGKTSLPFEEDFISQNLASIQKQVEDVIWNGDATGSTSTYLDITDGFIKVLEAASGVVAAKESGKTLSANTVEAINYMIAKIPNEVIDATDLTIFAGYEIVRKYVAAVNASNQFHTFLELTPDLTVMIPGTSVKLVGVAGLNGKNKAYASPAGNMYVGGDVEGDESTYKFWYSEDNSTFRLKVEFNLGVQVAFPDYVVSYID